MTDFNYQQAAKKTDDLLKKFGGTNKTNAILKQITKGTFDPITGKYSSDDPPVDFELNCVKLGYKQSDIDETLVKSGDQILLVSPFLKNGDPLPSINKNTDKIEINNFTWLIIEIKGVEPSDTLVLISLQIRRIN